MQKSVQKGNQFRRLDLNVGYVASSNRKYNMCRAKERGLREMLSIDGFLTIRVINPRGTGADLLKIWDHQVDNSFTTYVRKSPEELARKNRKRQPKPPEPPKASQPLSLEEEAAKLKPILPTDAERARVKTALKALVRGEPSDLYVAGFTISKFLDLNIVLGALDENDELSYAVASFIIPTQEFHLRFTPNFVTRGIWAYDVYVRDYHDWTHGGWEDVRVYEYLGHPQPRESPMQATEYLFGRQRDCDIGNGQFVVPVNHLTDRKFPQTVRATKNPPH